MKTGRSRGLFTQKSRADWPSRAPLTMLTPAAGIGCNDVLAVPLASCGGEPHATFSTRGRKDKDLNLAAALARFFLLIIDIPRKIQSTISGRQPVLGSTSTSLSPSASTGCSSFLCPMSVHGASLLPVNRMSQCYDERRELKRVGFDCSPFHLSLSSDLTRPARALTRDGEGRLIMH
ncbi:hypothetical protein BDW68DRAFT_8305 [Aspergillus falconensis]